MFFATQVVGRLQAAVEYDSDLWELLSQMLIYLHDRIGACPRQGTSRKEYRVTPLWEAIEGE